MTFTNLLTNLIVLTHGGSIPTNTAAFQNYAMQSSLLVAQDFAGRWHLDKNVVTSNGISSFYATPYPEGFSASIEFGDRYIFGIEKGVYGGFTDKKYAQFWAFPRLLVPEGTSRLKATDAWRSRYLEVEEQWDRATNCMTLKKAQNIAESAMAAAGVSAKVMGFKKPVKAEQLKTTFLHEEASLNKRSGVRPRPLPYYEFRWESKKGVCTVDVSGIISNIVYFEFVGPPFPGQPPQNYFEMLNLPTNAIFVVPRYGPLRYEVYAP